MAGGFTLSGGEALMQHRFAVKLFAAAPALGIHTALDTNGYYGDRLDDDELEAVDLVLLDLKGWDRGAPPPPDGHGDRARPSRSRAASPRGGSRSGSASSWCRP